MLIGGEIHEQQAPVTRQAIQTISVVAENMNAVVICGGTDMGVMAEIGQIRERNRYKFPLVGIAPEELVARAAQSFCGGGESVGSWSHITLILFLCPAASLGMNLRGLSMQQPYYPKTTSL